MKTPVSLIASALLAAALCQAPAQEGGGLVLNNQSLQRFDKNDPATAAEEAVKAAEEAGANVNAAPEAIDEVKAGLAELVPEGARASIGDGAVGVRILVNGGRKAFSNPMFLLEPGDTVRLEAEIESTNMENSLRSTGLPDAGSLHLRTVRDVIWRGAPTDQFTPLGSGSISWKSLARDGAASVVEAQAAVLVGTPQGGRWVLGTGKSRVVLLPGVPFNRAGDGTLMGQVIGVYPNEESESAPNVVRDRAANYAPPRVFYRVDDNTRWALLAPHTYLGYLAPPVFEEDRNQVRYVPVSNRLVTFWSAFNQVVQERGHDAHNLMILRGFVSPNDRLRLARQDVELAEYTRYQYGDAVAVIFDSNWDGHSNVEHAPRMTDMNGDGRMDLDDVELLADIAEETMKSLGIFGALIINTEYEGPGPAKGTPYLHIDLRGWFLRQKD